MKKTFSANIDGKLFNIDDDAYALLNDYLTQLHTAFPGDEGNEIVADIEARIAELFGERVNAGSNVIVIADVNSVIETMGRPCDISDNPAAADDAPADGAHEGATPPPFSCDTSEAAARSDRRLYRDLQRKVLGGVLSGLARYLNWDVWVMRGLLLVLIFVVSSWWPRPFDNIGWMIVIAYMVAWMVIPPATNQRQVLEMMGQPVTVDNIGRNVLKWAERKGRAYAADGGVLDRVARVLGRILMSAVGLAGLGGLLACAVFGTIGTLGLTNVLTDYFQPLGGSLDLDVMCVKMLLWSLAGVIPSVAAIWSACCTLFGSKRASSATIIAAVVVDVILIAAAIVVSILAENIYVSI